MKKYNDATISKYLLDKSEKNIEIPYMTTISRDTGISNATISRYAKRKGYLNFGELRASYNRTLGSSFKSYDSRGFNSIYKYNTVKIVCSKSTEIISLFLKDRLEFTGQDIHTDDDNFSEQDVTLFITITGDSLKIREGLQKTKGKKLIITTEELDDLPKNAKQIILREFKIELRNKFDIWNSIVKIINWLNTTINIYQIDSLKIK